ncbi:hypothetical protein ACOZ38_36350 [Sphaerisporangium viridialbum]|uniref:hypothetical protein n=1 Tax=Sphaerisporangium viridialbum TaxID=46189 RepID=UPI003C74A2F2
MIHAQHDRLWLGVVDEGAAHSPRVFAPGDEEESGRGLVMVGALADTYGVRGDERGRTVWTMLLVNAGKNPRLLPCRGQRHRVHDRLPQSPCQACSRRGLDV